MVEVKGRWALITGAARGIGRLTALFLAERGCNLVLHSSNLAHTEKVLEEVKAFGVEAYAVACDLTDTDAIERMCKEVDELGVQIDILFNNAGKQVQWNADFYKTPAWDFMHGMMINAIAPALITYHFMEGMVERGFGRIINTSSGITNIPELESYAMGKAAIDKFTYDLASKVDGTDVMINLTDPNWCSTDLGGKDAPNKPESTMPGYVVGAFVDDKKSGRLMPAQDFKGMTLEDAVKKAEAEY